VATKLDPYKGIIHARLDAFPQLTAQRLLEEIRAAGYAGGYTQLKAFVREIRPRPPEEPVIRFETAPGFQGQVDFATFDLPWGRRYALLVVLGYSRLLWLRFFARQTMEVLLRGLEAAFEYFGGVPHELLFDQMRAVVTDDRRDDGGPLVLNSEFLRFAEHWGFRPRACRPYRARTKGKVERPIRYCRQSFFYGRAFVSDEDLNAQAAHWMETVANVRRHRTIGEPPRIRFERDERVHLKPLALQPFPRLAVVPKPPARPGLTGALEVERRPLSVYAEAAR
jgi:transposase